MAVRASGWVLFVFELAASSDLHRRVEKHLCKEDSVLRLVMEVNFGWICINNSTEYSSANALLKCIGTCGEPVECLSPTTPITLTGSATTLNKLIQQEKHPGCGKNSNNTS